MVNSLEAAKREVPSWLRLAAFEANPRVKRSAILAVG